MFDNNQRYGKVTRLLHWGMALLLFWQFVTVGARVLAKDSAFDQFMWATHKPLGALLLLLIAARAVWAFANRSRRPASLNVAAKVGHISLYGVMLLVPALALLRQYGSGRAFEPFGIPLFAGFEGRIEWMIEPGNLLHSSLGWLLMVMVIGHIGMVIWHKKRAGQVDVLPPSRF